MSMTPLRSLAMMHTLLVYGLIARDRSALLASIMAFCLFLIGTTPGSLVRIGGPALAVSVIIPLAGLLIFAWLHHRQAHAARLDLIRKATRLEREAESAESAHEIMSIHAEIQALTPPIPPNERHPPDVILAEAELIRSRLDRLGHFPVAYAVLAAIVMVQGFLLFHLRPDIPEAFLITNLLLAATLARFVFLAASRAGQRTFLAKLEDYLARCGHMADDALMTALQSELSHWRKPSAL